jgi:hypothetical protein
MEMSPEELEEKIYSMQRQIDDHDENLKHIMKQFGPASWVHIQKQRRDNAPKPPLSTHHDQRFGQSNKPLAT